MIGSLTLDQLRVLVAIADTGSFSAAGRRLGRVQSAMSQSIASLEAAQGVAIFDRSGYRPVLTETGRVLVEQARIVLRGATYFEMVAASTRNGLEPELALAIDPLVPSEPFIDALRDLNRTHPDLPISFATEGLGGSLRRLRDGSASLGICTLLPIVPDDLIAYPLARTVMRPVVGAGHPLASVRQPISSHELEPHVQLVLSDPVDPGGQNFGLASARLWRFADLNRRYDFLLAGFGWCRMPEHSVLDALADGRLVALAIKDDTAPPDGLTIFAAHLRDRVLGRGAAHLLSALRERFAS
ncbi:LysR family transcriptional regulator [Salinarimonas ramus]|uniref:LysR family transcriptional regulator n=1 Tax=Salinarimonas ramus TaxID=690164 RepID=A0A917V9N0_9HYPH|nr:LysR family transcriptional regulator [Salinarimonas ramus]GGK52706.1 LysR family transcriptional regulator [Salinarimonas ramus]